MKLKNLFILLIRSSPNKFWNLLATGIIISIFNCDSKVQTFFCIFCTLLQNGGESASAIIVANSNMSKDNVSVTTEVNFSWTDVDLKPIKWTKSITQTVLLTIY